MKTTESPSDALPPADDVDFVAPVQVLHLGLGWFDDHAGGLERYQHGICEAHADRGIPVQAMVLSGQSPLVSAKYPAIAYASPRDARSQRAAKLRLAIRQWIGKGPQSNRVIVSHHASVAGPVLNEIKSFQRLGGRFVVQFQGPWADEAFAEGAGKIKTFFQRRMERRVYQSANHVLTLSHAFKQVVVQRYGVLPSDVSVVPGGIDASAADCGIDRSACREKLNWPADVPTLVCVRRLVRRVGVDVLVHAMSKIAIEIPDIRLMVGGRGPLMDHLTDMVRQSGLDDRVKMLGFIRDEDLPLVYGAADLSVVPTQSLEGFGLITLESLACGTPVAATPVGSLPEVLRPLDDSLLFASNSAESIAEGVVGLLRDVATLPTSIQCRQYVRDHFDWSVIAPRVLDVYTGRTGGSATHAPCGER